MRRQFYFECDFSSAQMEWEFFADTRSREDDATVLLLTSSVLQAAFRLVELVKQENTLVHKIFPVDVEMRNT